jgi:hypothetical protein
MIRIVRPALASAIPGSSLPRVLSVLAVRRADAAILQVNPAKLSKAALSKRVVSRWNSFVAGSGRNAGVGPVVCTAIRGYCREKCVYCEAPEAATIDHVWPKVDHPAKMFDWDNLVAACRDCNSSKRSGFPLSAHGKPLQIDPTVDEPLDHFRWNHLSGECEHDPSNPRAVHTFGAFDMDRLARERIEKLLNVRLLLSLSLSLPPTLILLEVHDRLRAELDEGRPYLCIVRSYLLHPPDARERALIKAAVAAVPDILAWVAPWLLPPTGAVWPP